MPKLRVLLPLALGLFAAATPALANTLSGEDIRREIIGKRIFLATPLGGELPLNYRRDGRVDGSGEAIGLGRFFRPTDDGRWWIDGNRLCQQWRTWYDGQQMCFTLRRTSEGRLAWRRDNGETGVARIGE